MDKREFEIIRIGKIVPEATGDPLEIFEQYRKAFLELDNYSHPHVYYYESQQYNNKKRKNS